MRCAFINGAASVLSSAARSGKRARRHKPSTPSWADHGIPLATNWLSVVDLGPKAILADFGGNDYLQQDKHLPRINICSALSGWKEYPVIHRSIRAVPDACIRRQRPRTRNRR